MSRSYECTLFENVLKVLISPSHEHLLRKVSIFLTEATMGRKSRRAGGRAQLGARQTLSRASDRVNRANQSRTFAIA